MFAFVDKSTFYFKQHLSIEGRVAYAYEEVVELYPLSQWYVLKERVLGRNFGENMRKRQRNMQVWVE